MKNFRIYNLLALILMVSITVSCVKSDDFDIPETSVVEEPVLDGEIVTISAMAGQYEQELDNYTFEDTNTYLEGYVISSDEAGNFFEEIILQDDPTNPTLGIRVLLDENPLFTKYEVGRKLYIKLDGLTLGISNGVLTLGVAGTSFVQAIPAPLEEEHIIRSAEVATITPVNITLEELASLPLSDDDDSFRVTNLYVNIENVQFIKNQVVDNNYTYASEGFDEFDGERTIENCDTKDRLTFSTSTFADFKSLLLPTGRGNISGILTKDFFADKFILVVNDPSTVNLTDENRCDPEPTGTFVCDTPSGGGNVFWSENFEQFNAIEDYVDAGWTNVNVNGGSTLWVIGNFDGTNYAQISGFNSGEDVIETWLVTPSIDMDGTTEEELMMDIQTNFDNGEILSVLFSTNFTGDVTTADWETLAVSIPTGPSDGFGTFEAVGPVNISCIDGTINLAFLYQGSDPSATTRYHIDNIEITGN